MKVLGRHLLVEYHGCDPEILNDLERVKKFMLEAASESGATVLDASFHYFTPQGVSGVVVIAESHLAIHTWPEYGYAAVDIFTCGNAVDPWKAFHYLRSTLGSKETSVNEIVRGELSHLQSRASRVSM
ncbi:MAG TPA: adenosylmethionine decarboxylase [Thermodesulfobacteriota bacterium]|nr:adenosylmethionine decarboxylase [Thermodesulfobacteriota bacterium]